MNKLSLTMMVAVALCACEKPRKVEAFSEPFAVTVDGSGVVPTFELAMMVSKGGTPAPLVQPATTLLVQALKKCASSDDKKEHKVLAEIALSATAEPDIKVSASQQPFEACLGEALKSTKVEWPHGEAVVTRVELRLGNRSGT